MQYPFYCYSNYVYDIPVLKPKIIFLKKACLKIGKKKMTCLNQLSYEKYKYHQKLVGMDVG